MLKYSDHILHERCFVEGGGGMSWDEQVRFVSSSNGHSWSSALPPLTSTCECENGKLLHEEVFSDLDHSRWINGEYDQAKVWHCQACGWWQLYVSRFRWSSCCEQTTYAFHTGILKAWPDDDRAIVEEVKCVIDRGRSYLTDVDPIAFEKAMAGVYRAHYPGASVKHVGKSNDKGIDLYVVNEDETYLVQVKRRSNGAAETVETVQHLMGAWLRVTVPTKKCSFHVVTTAPRFTKDALKAKADPELARRNFSVELIAFDRVKEMLDLASHADVRPWQHIQISRELVERPGRIA